jgi:integrase
MHVRVTLVSQGLYSLRLYMATVKFYLRDYKIDKQLRKDDCSIVAKFTIDRINRFQINLKEKIQPKHWDFKSQQVKSSYRGHYEINIYLSDFKTKLLTLYREHREMPFDKFKQLVISSENKSQKKTLFIALSEFLEAYKMEKDIKTLQKYLTLQRKLEEFDSETPIDFQTLDFKFYDKFKSFLYAIQNPFYRKFRLIENDGVWEMIEGDKGEPVGIFDDQVFAYIIQLKTFLGWAEKRGFQVNSSYKSWEKIRRIHKPITLTMDEFSKLESAVFTSKALDTARDYLVFACRTGQRISDIKRFDLKDYSDFKWRVNQRKGNRLVNKSVTVHFKQFCAPALEIIQKYNWKMPKISEQKLNDNIKRACKEAGIDSEFFIYRWAANKRIKISGFKHEFISSHIGRKTFITLALQSGMPESYVMRLTGITENKTLKHYKGDFEDVMIEDYLKQMGNSIMRKAQ